MVAPRSANPIATHKPTDSMAVSLAAGRRAGLSSVGLHTEKAFGLVTRALWSAPDSGSGAADVTRLLEPAALRRCHLIPAPCAELSPAPADAHRPVHYAPRERHHVGLGGFAMKLGRPGTSSHCPWVATTLLPNPPGEHASPTGRRVPHSFGEHTDGPHYRAFHVAARVRPGHA